MMDQEDSIKRVAKTPFNLSNMLSLSRAPLALLYSIARPDFRVTIVVLAMLTDIIDGYLARRYQFATKIGAILDPLMDKFFVFCVVGILFSESKILGWQIAAMLTRDIAILIFGSVLFSMGRLRKYDFQSVFSGKLMTAFQFAILFLLSLNLSVPNFFYYPFFFLGPIVLGEFFFTLKSKR